MASSLATTGPHVRIRTTPDQQQIPEWLRVRLHLGARRAEQLRLDIAERAGLPTLPAVEIFPVIWRLDGELVLGRTGVVERDGELHLGVLLPAASVAQSDDDLLRATLLVQFSNCISRLVRAAAQGRAAPTPPSLVDPATWFGPDDVARLKSWKDPRIIGVEILADFLSKSLPTLAPPPDDVPHDFHVPHWVLARVESPVERSPLALGDRS